MPVQRVIHTFKRGEEEWWDVFTKTKYATYNDEADARIRQWFNDMNLPVSTRKALVGEATDDDPTPAPAPSRRTRSAPVAPSSTVTTPAPSTSTQPAPVAPSSTVTTPAPSSSTQSATTASATTNTGPSTNADSPTAEVANLRREIERIQSDNAMRME